MARYTYSCPMRWSDMDAYGHVNNVQFLTYLEEARIDMLHGLIERAKERDGAMSAGMLVASSSIEYRRPLVHRTAPVPITLWVSRVGGAFFDLSHEVADPDVVYARATSRIVPYDFRVERPRRLTADEKEFLQGHLEPVPAVGPVR